jgi:hypothetical protein
LGFLAESAGANVYDLTYSTSSGDTANLVLTTQNTLTSNGYGSGYEITGVTGTRDGIAVAGLLTFNYPHFPSPFGSRVRCR